MDSDFKRKKKEIYIPLKAIVNDVIKRLKGLYLNIPISQIARMDLAGKFQDDRTSMELFQKTIHDYLRLANKYRSTYFEYLKKTKLIFDREMNKDGSFAPGLKQYNSVKIQLFEALLKSDNRAWILSYDQYLPTIREHANKRSSKPRSGKKMLNDMKKIFDPDLKKIMDLQTITIQVSKLLIKDLDFAIKNPDLGWQEWLSDEKLPKE